MMKRDVMQLRALTIASFKMYYRNKTAVFFSLFIPIFIVGIFGVILKGGNTTFNMGIVDNAHNQDSQSIISTLKKTHAFTISQGSYSTELNNLKQGNEDLILDIPSTFTTTSQGEAKITGLYDQKNAQNAQTAFLIINTLLDKYNQGIFTQQTGLTIPTYLTIAQKGIETSNLTEIDFLIPGIVGFSIMQLGLFSVAFAFTTMKKTGALRRLQATPAKPSIFIIAESLSRLILALIQVAILFGIGLFFFGLHMYGNYLYLLVFILLGATVFLAIGFAIAGYAKDENQAAPIANLISLPMMFLSGVFFPRSLMPDFLKNVTSVLPLTYLNDALRQIANNGTSITHLGGDLLGLIIWAIICMIIAVKVFKWE
jgi:ABC-2 type transport system permease protein